MSFLLRSVVIWSVSFDSRHSRWQQMDITFHLKAVTGGFTAPVILCTASLSSPRCFHCVLCESVQDSRLYWCHASKIIPDKVMRMVNSPQAPDTKEKRALQELTGSPFCLWLLCEESEFAFIWMLFSCPTLLVMHFRMKSNPTERSIPARCQIKPDCSQEHSGFLHIQVYYIFCVKSSAFFALKSAQNWFSNNKALLFLNRFRDGPVRWNEKV